MWCGGLQLSDAVFVKQADLEYTEPPSGEVRDWSVACEEVAVGVEFVCVVGVAERVLYAPFEYAGIWLVEVLGRG